VGRPGHQADLEEPFCDEGACRRVGVVLGSELPDFFPKQSTDRRGLARLGGALPRYRFQLEGLDPRLRRTGSGAERVRRGGGGEGKVPWLELWRDNACDAEGQATLMS
jgi:hypothetical protein